MLEYDKSFDLLLREEIEVSKQLLDFNIMLESKKIWKNNSLSYLFAKSNMSKYWFSGILSASDQLDIHNFEQDLQKSEMYQLLSILNISFADIMGFSNKQPSQSIFKLLEIMKKILKLFHHQNQLEVTLTYRTWMFKLHFLNTLGLFSMKNKQYTYALNCYQEITNIYQNGPIDTINQIFLVSFNNYIICLKAYDAITKAQKIANLTKELSDIYGGLLNRYFNTGCSQNNILLLFTIYKQQQVNLKKVYRPKNSMLIRKLLQIKQTNENPATDILLYQQFMKKNKINKYCQLVIRKYEFDFFYTISHESQNVKRASQLRKRKQDQKLKLQTPEDRLGNIEKLLEEHLGTLGSLKSERLTSTISITPEKQKNDSPKKSSTMKQILEGRESLNFKTNQIYLQVSSEGIIVSDFLKEDKQFLSWNSMKSIMKRFRYPAIFTTVFPINTYYDVARILSLFLKYETKNHKKCLILKEYPNELISLNLHAKIYRKMKEFVTVYIMNIYDVSVVEEIIECYISDFSYFFKTVNNNEYIQAINKSMLTGEYDTKKIYTMETLKKTTETIRQQLQNQINITEYRQIITEEIRKSIFKILLIFKNSKRFLLYFSKIDTDYLQFSIREMKIQDKPKIRTLKLPKYIIKKYFPFQDDKVLQFFKMYGMCLIEGYRHCFQDYPFSFLNKNFLNVTIFTKKTEMISIGRYKTPVTAMIIGAKNRVWGIVIKYYEINSSKQSVTFIFNPCYELLIFVLTMNEEQRRMVLDNSLFKGSVKQTYNLLLKKGKLGKTLFLSQYWNYFV